MSERNVNEHKFVLVLLDLLAFFGALHAAIYFRYSAGLPFSKGGSPPWQEILQAFPFVALAWVMINAMFGSYRFRQSALDEIGGVVRATLLTFLLVLSATFFYRGFSYSRGMIGFLIPLVVVSVLVVRLGFRSLRRRVLRRFAGQARIAILGCNKVGESLAQALLRDRDYYEVVGVVDTAPAGAPGQCTRARGPSEPPVLGHIDELEAIFAAHRIDTLILVDRMLDEAKVLDSIEACLRHQVTWNMVPGVHELLVDRARVEVVDGIPLVGMRRSNIVGFNWAIKRMFDIGASLLLLALASPLMIGVALAIKLSSRGPVLYVQQRVGYRGRVFRSSSSAPCT